MERKVEAADKSDLQKGDTGETNAASGGEVTLGDSITRNWAEAMAPPEIIAAFEHDPAHVISL
jgi:hypothetical protein